MAEPIVTAPPRRGPKALTALLIIVAALLIIALAVVFALTGGGVIASPASVIGPPVRVAGDHGDRVYVLTSQWKTYASSYRGRTNRTDLLVDVWAFDGASAKPVWRRRLAKSPRGVNMGRALLGAQAGALWTLQASGPVALSLTDGSVTADTARLEVANPALKGLIPTEERYYRFDGEGLAFTAADGRSWRLAGADLKLVPTTTRASDKPPAAGVTLPARLGGGNGTSAFMERGLQIGGHWLGLMGEPEVANFRTYGAIGGIDPASHPRMRLWSARVGATRTFFGARSVFSDFAPLPEGPEFLNAGLLSNGDSRSDAPLLLFKPDSVLVLHRHRLGDQGRVQLSRVAGPAGKPLWTADLPMTAVEAVMPGETSIVLLGRRDEPGPRRGPDSDRPVSVDQIVAVDLASGKVGAYGFKVKATKPEEIPPSSTTLP